MVRATALTREKVTVTLPPDLVTYAERKAAESKTSRSQVIAEALAEMKAREEESLAAEGYRFYAEEARQFADATLDVVSEVLGNAD